MKASSPTLPHRDARIPETFLPDFCNIRIVFIIIVITELLAFILALAPQGQAQGRWSDLGLISLFMQWVALSCTTLMCALRTRLNRLGNGGAGVASFGLILLVTAALSEAAYLIGSHTGLSYVQTPDWHQAFLLRNLLISAIVGAVILRYFYVQHQTRRNSAAEAQARFQALQARIRPHFIFNSLNTIASLTRSQPGLAEELIEDLADLFRVNLSNNTSVSTLEEELALSRRYLKIEKFRLGERLRLRWRLDEVPMDATLPSLLIQPLLENAIYHGIEPLVEGGEILVRGSCRDGRIVIDISNPIPTAPPQGRRHSNHMALENIRERLALHFGPDGTLATSERDGQFQATLSFPCQRRDHENPDH
ncbi:MAG TPA: sensor histidine kinase [Gammaproteobacteria bacterium]|nr:sensor histidine kinase [Gammaproteobacteria bacterium]